MKLAFVIDNTQTVQSIVGILAEALRRGNECFVFATCSVNSIANISTVEQHVDRLRWFCFRNRVDAVDRYCSMRSLFDATIGINLFNTIFSRVYSHGEHPIYSVEHCWNDFYRFSDDIASDATLFANSEWSAETIRELSGYKNIKFMGSQWFEFISGYGRDDRDAVVLAAPHDTFYQKSPELADHMPRIITSLRGYCDDHSLKFILKTRMKFKSSAMNDQLRSFDGIVYDMNSFEHLETYARARAVVHFCSSAINELAFLRVPSISLLPDVYLRLHAHEQIAASGMQKIHDQYYDGEINDLAHCAAVDSHRLYDAPDLPALIDAMVASQHDWHRYHSEFFSGEHTGAAASIVEAICNAGRK